MNTPSDKLPVAVSWLGHGGLLPFGALALAAWLLPAWRAPALHALLAYGAVILSFVGALHWGLAMAQPGLDGRWRQRAFVWSVVPSLIGWAAIAWPALPAAAGAIVLAGGFLLHLQQDHALARATALPGWYLPLRRRLTLIAVASLAAGALAAQAAG
ncbi:DUF3429 domain-containing protein [Hydrogenophaga crocea]|uniref:DUF3429 domain-containing protein n=1 Tax=Hydrogenophaga crocea TaxID=2716225 RepID=A0A6G8IC73_9BURK|nr:DUF3429 domain-containing protein [Hydrogenophaga crocea]QIM50655.1 DUF3429 domain-containing protein [Hydrogenophaga crocea]